MLKHFRNRTKDYGKAFIRLASGNISSITANTTTRFSAGAISDKDDTGASPGHQGYIEEIIVSTFTVPADADGTILLTVKKWDASAAAAVTLVTGAAAVGTGDLEALTQGKGERLTFDAALTDAQRTLDFGDSLYFEIVNNSAAIDTQPNGLNISALVALLK